MVVIDQMSNAGTSLSELLAPFRRYHASGEINSVVEDKEGAIERIAAAHGNGRQDRLDGLTVEYEDWWFNVRPSNTEPLLRLNVEARSPELLADKTEALLSLITAEPESA
jgi:phosphomannomutase